MEATLQAEKRETAAARTRRGGCARRAAFPPSSTARRRARRPRSPVDPKVLLRILHSESGVNTLIGLEGADLGAGGKVLVKEYQLDPIDHKLLHADFYAVAMDKMLTVTVPVVLKGEPKGVKQQGGIVDFVNREIEVECLPADIPEHIDIDISELMLHQGVRVRDLPQDAKWKPISEPDMMIVHVVTREGRGSRRRRRPRRRAAPARRRSPKSSRRARRTRKTKKTRSRRVQRRPSPAGRAWSMKLVVGLGNPGPKYAGTRHNVGFDAVDLLARRHGLDVGGGAARDRGADRASGGRAARSVAKPLTFMNLSGTAIVGLLQFYKIELADLLVIVDEVQLETGRHPDQARRIGRRAQRAEVDHRSLGTEAFPRLRIGVGRGDTRRDLADHVLARFEPDERSVDRRRDRPGGGRRRSCSSRRVAAAMNRFNRKDDGPDTPETEDGNR